jgi:hypothetical protein
MISSTNKGLRQEDFMHLQASWQMIGRFDLFNLGESVRAAWISLTAPCRDVGYTLNTLVGDFSLRNH